MNSRAAARMMRSRPDAGSIGMPSTLRGQTGRSIRALTGVGRGGQARLRATVDGGPLLHERRSPLDGVVGTHDLKEPPALEKPKPAPTALPKPRPVSALSWAWPTDRMSAPQPVSGGGILLPGRVGQDIRAASSGRVVYNGSGIRGYGNLIIIKHGENLLSAYAHTRESLVHDGQEVTQGQVIAHMGEGAPQKPVLYFEIRRNGKPVDLLAFLPTIK